MPLFMDTHNNIDGLTAEVVVRAPRERSRGAGEVWVNYIKGWFNEASGKVFCLVRAPNAEAAAAVHREAHGLLADEITPVQEFS